MHVIRYLQSQMHTFPQVEERENQAKVKVEQTQHELGVNRPRVLQVVTHIHIQKTIGFGKHPNVRKELPNLDSTVVGLRGYNITRIVNILPLLYQKELDVIGKKK